MPKFVVVFDRPVWYQPDHYQARRETQALEVVAPTPAAAMTHAIRVTRGEGEILDARPTAETPEHLVILARSVTTPPMRIDPATGLRTMLPEQIHVAAPEVLSGA